MDIMSVDRRKAEALAEATRLVAEAGTAQELDAVFLDAAVSVAHAAAAFGFDYAVEHFEQAGKNVAPKQSRVEAVRLIKKLMQDGATNDHDKGAVHFGVLELRELLDFIYDGPPANEDEHLKHPLGGGTTSYKEWVPEC